MNVYDSIQRQEFIDEIPDCDFETVMKTSLRERLRTKSYDDLSGLDWIRDDGFYHEERATKEQKEKMFNSRVERCINRLFYYFTT